MTFGEALEALKDGKKVTRQGWNGKNMYLVLVVKTADTSCDSVEVFKDIARPLKNHPESPCKKYVPTDAYIVIRTSNGTVQPGWVPTQADMLSDNWYILE